MRFTYYTLALTILTTIISCKSEKQVTVTADCTTTPKAFAANVNPIIQSKCANGGCHNASNAGGLMLLNYSQVQSRLSTIQQRTLVAKNMPPSAPLSASEQAILKCWIDAGAPNN